MCMYVVIFIFILISIVDISINIKSHYFGERSRSPQPSLWVFKLSPKQNPKP